jgi:hypothetical protein
MPSHLKLARWIGLATCGVLTLPASMGLPGCGGGTSGGSTNGMDATAEAAPPHSDSGSSADAELDEAGLDSGSGENPDANSNPADAGCSSTKGKACDTCCKAAFPSGAKALLEAALMCVCASPGLCSASDGGGTGDDGGSASDGGDVLDGGGGDASGDGVCAASCGGAKGTPDTACLACVAATSGKQGACYQSDQAACQSNTQCAAYVGCLASCQ